MEQGECTYSSFVDGDTVVGNLKVKSTATLILKLDRAKLVTNSKIGGNVFLQLDGPRDYGVTFKNLNREGMRKKGGFSSSFFIVNLMGELSV